MRALVLALILVLPVVAVFVPTADAATVHVTVQNFNFSPSSVSINKGDTVQWNWASGTHNVRSSDDLTYWCGTQSSGSCSKTFSTAGTFRYHCAIHTSMTGTVNVAGDPPTISIDSPADGSSVSGVFTVSGTATGPEGLAKVEVRIGGGAWQLATGTTTWSHDIDTASLSNGAELVEARATGGDGQTATASITVEVANPERVDLWLYTLQGQTSLTGSPTITFIVRNTGNVDLSSSVRLEYRYKNAWHTIEDVPVQVNGFATKTYTEKWVSFTHVGRFDIRGTVDPDGLIAEVDETNNQRQHAAAFYTSSFGGKDLRDL